MSDVEKIIKALEHHKDTWACNGCPYEDDPDVGNGKCPVYDDAIALLRKQEPVKREFVRGVKPEFRRGVPSCGMCGNVLANHYRNCPWCGCEVKWDA